MNKPKAQGTAWETELVRRAQARGLLADRMPEGGLNDAGDVWIVDHPIKSEAVYDMVVVAWSRLVKNGDGRRNPDGLRSVIVMDTDNFLDLASLAAKNNIAFVVECKATERLNVTRELADAKRKLNRWKER